MSHLMFILICMIWGTSFILMKRAMASFGVIGVGAWRVVFGAAALFVAWKLMKKPWPFVRRDIGPILFIAVIGYAIPFCFQPYVVREVQATAGHGGAFGGMMISFVPLFTVLMSIPMLRIYPSTRQVFGIVGGMVCVYLLYADELRQGVTLKLLLMGATTPLCYGITNTYLKRRFNEGSSVAVTMVTLAATAMLLVPLSAAVETVHVDEHLTMSITYLALLGVICTGIANAMSYKLIKGHGPLYVAMVTYIIPCVAIFIGWLDGERFTGNQISALAGILAMVALVQWPTRKGASLPPPAEGA